MICMGPIDVFFSRIPGNVQTRIRKTIESILLGEMPGRRWEVSIADVDSQVIRRLNRVYRRKDTPTDVLSFILEPPRQGRKGYAEIVTCTKLVSHRARKLGRPYLREFKYLLVHACLHIVGYDHEVERQRRKMEEREQYYLSLIL